MSAEIFRNFTFEAAHCLPNVPKDHKCSRLHGHTYQVSVHLSGPIQRRSGWVLDFGEITAAFAPVLDQLDHHFLNNIIPNPTSENLARWIWEQLLGLPYLNAVIVSETDSTGCVYRGE